jgi:succinoglycan biosynthesis transport protein ExoP
MSPLETGLPRSELEQLSLADLLSVLIRHKKMIGFTSLCLVVLSIMYCIITPKIYKADAVILIESQEKNVEIKSVLADVINDQSLIPSEIQVLLSRNLMAKVLAELKADVPEEKLSNEELKEFKEEKIDNALRNLDVKQIDKSRAIVVSFKSRDANFAANVVNALTKNYIEQQISNNFEAVSLTNSWLADRVVELQNKVTESERKVEEYRAQKGLINGEGDLANEDFMGLSKKLSDAKARLADAESKLSEVSDINNLESAPSVLSSTLIQKLREAESDTRSELASLSSSLGKNHPKIKDLQAKLYSAQSKIKLETEKIAEGIKREHETAIENVGLIEKQIANSKENYATDQSENVSLAALEREAETNRKFLETINLRWKETQSQEDSRLQAPYARILSSASIPNVPESPKKKMIMLSALLAGLGLGAGLALIKDQMQNTVYNGKQIQSLTGFTNISMIADARSHKHAAIPNFADIPLSDQTSEFMEGIREISAFLKLQKSRAPNDKVFCFSSATKNEGKSSLVASLSRQLALEGVKVLAIDCDIRAQSLTKMFAVSDRQGLSEVLTGRASLNEVIISDTKSPLSLIAIGQSQGNINLFLRSPEAWKKMINDVAYGFDIVLLDNSPSLSTPEAKIISGIGQNIFCIRWKKTPLNVVAFALDSLRRSGSNVVGTIVTMAENKFSGIYISDKNAT